MIHMSLSPECKGIAYDDLSFTSVQLVAISDGTGSNFPPAYTLHLHTQQQNMRVTSTVRNPLTGTLIDPENTSAHIDCECVCGS
jgi:hypothetical protein